MLRLIALSMCLSALAVSAILLVLADEHTTKGERILVWISVGALPILLAALVALLVRLSRTSHFFEVAEHGP